MQHRRIKSKDDWNVDKLVGRVRVCVRDSSSLWIQRKGDYHRRGFGDDIFGGGRVGGQQGADYQ